MTPSQDSSLTQSRTMSFIEAITNVVAGYFIALLMQTLLFAVLGVYLSITENASIAAVFTIVSIVRSYCIRRLFERVSRRGRDHSRAD
jgi:hypothetical protein